jgi:hypothetical protein
MPACSMRSPTLSDLWRLRDMKLQPWIEGALQHDDTLKS